MTLLWPKDEQQIDLSAGKLHALIIGVGDYPHMSGGGGNPAVANFGLQQLTTTPITARAISRWLLKNRPQLATTLGSVEVLMSPAQTINDDRGNPTVIELAKMSEIETAFKKWWSRCNRRPDNVAMFYFAGHGLSTASHYLLPSDFGDPANPDLWRNCLDFTSMRIGMRANAADTQLFFVDACRETPIDALAQRNPSGDGLCSSGIFDDVDTSAAYFSAVDGKLAYGPDDDKTFFAQALIESLDGTGANNNGGVWTVDTFSLSNSIGKVLEMIKEATGHPLKCNPDVSGTPKAICYPPSGKVKTSIGCLTPQANTESVIKLERNGVRHESPQGDPRPWLERVDAGEWKIDFQFQTQASISFKDTLMPPTYVRVEQV